MIKTESRFRTVFGGAAGYIAITFAALLIALHLQLFVPTTTSLFPPGDQANSKPNQPLPSISMRETPRKRAIPQPSISGFKEYAEDIFILQQKELLFPLKETDRSAMKNTFRAARSGGRLHEGVDILAPRNTPVVAIDDGHIARMWVSPLGGLTIYQFDPTSQYVYYYAHLEKYAPDLKEKMTVRRGQIIGFVGTSGNAPPGTPHLHFAIYRASSPGRWARGIAIDPYSIFNTT